MAQIEREPFLSFFFSDGLDFLTGRAHRWASPNIMSHLPTIRIHEWCLIHENSKLPHGIDFSIRLVEHHWKAWDEDKLQWLMATIASVSSSTSLPPSFYILFNLSLLNALYHSSSNWKLLQNNPITKILLFPAQLHILQSELKIQIQTITEEEDPDL